MLNLISLSLQATPAGDWQLHLNGKATFCLAFASAYNMKLLM